MIRFATAVFVVTAVVYVVCAAPIPFYDRGEPREALSVMGIAHGEAVILPRRAHEELSAKPPLFHWLAALAVLGGVSPEELAIRLPSVLLGAAGVALTAVEAARGFGITAGVLSAVVLGSTFEWFRAATQARVDMTLTFFILAAIVLARRVVLGEGGAGTLRAAYGCVVLAVLTKGPVGAVLPALVLTVDAALDRRIGSLRRLVDWPAVLGAAVLSAGWYLLAWRAGGGAFVSLQLLHENVHRFLGVGDVAHRHPVGYYVPALAGGFFPWTLVLPGALVLAWRRWTTADRFLLVWAGTILAFFAVAAGKRSVYLLPLFPAAAILAARFLAAWVRDPPGVIGRTSLLVVAGVLALTAAAIALGGATRLGGLPGGLVGGGDRSRLLGFLPGIAEERWALVGLFAALSACVVGLRASGTTSRLVALVAIGFLWSLGLTALGTYPLAVATTPREAARNLRARLLPDDRVCARGELTEAYRYYLGRETPPCRRDDAGRVAYVIDTFPDPTTGGTRFREIRVASEAARQVEP